MYYGQLQEILEFKYLLFKVVLFRVKWFDTRNKGRKVKHLVLRNNMTQIDTRAESFKDDITDDEDAIPPDLAESNNEDLINVDDDGVDKMSADIARSHDGDDGGEDRPSPHHVPNGCMSCFANRGPISIQFELHDKQTVMPLGDHAAHWSSYIEEVIRGVPLYYPSWLKVPKERKAALITDIGTPRPGLTMSRRSGGNVLRTLRLASGISILSFGMIPGTLPEPLKIGQNRAKSTVISRQESRSLARLRDEMEEMRRLEAMGTYTDDKINLLDRGGNQRGHIAGVGRVLSARVTANPRVAGAGTRRRVHYQDDEDEDGDGDTVTLILIKVAKEEVRRLEAMGIYTDDEINRLARGGKHRGHIAGVGRVLPARATASPSTLAHESTLNSLHKKVDFMMIFFKSDSKYSDMFSQFESGGASGSGGCGDEEEGADHQDDEDEDDDGDT
nr:F-box domain, leucine-rich repeat domain, L domain-like protein [Tanacetum cinerariifolium]